jgi:hypothetical protein
MSYLPCDRDQSPSCRSDRHPVAPMPYWERSQDRQQAQYCRHKKYLLGEEAPLLAVLDLRLQGLEKFRIHP